jgi:large conductance mechanosensitive channel
VITGIALGAVVDSLVKDIIMPPIGLALGGSDFDSLKSVLKAATGGDPTTEVAIRYGAFINTIIAFVIIAFVVYGISRMFVREAPPTPTKTCPVLQRVQRVGRHELPSVREPDLKAQRWLGVLPGAALSSFGGATEPRRHRPGG